MKRFSIHRFNERSILLVFVVMLSIYLALVALGTPSESAIDVQLHAEVETDSLFDMLTICS